MTNGKTDRWMGRQMGKNVALVHPYQAGKSHSKFG